MNEFESTLVTALRGEAEEIAMKVDLTNADQELNRRLDTADSSTTRRRAMWVAAAVAAIVVAIGAVVVMGRPSSHASPPTVATPSPSLPSMPIDTSTLSPNVALALPGWTAYAHRGGWAKDTIKYAQTEDCGGRPCPVGADRNFVLITPSFFYAPGDPTTIVSAPTYANYVAAWDSLPANGMGTVSDRRTTTVDGRRAVLMTVDFTSSAAGLAACESDIEQPADCWNTAAGRTARVAIIDGGAAGPLVLYDAVNTANPDKAGLAAEMDTVLATVTLT